MTGPLEGIRVIELAGIGPAPFCCMLLADMGAEVIRLEQVNDRGKSPWGEDPLRRNRKMVAVNTKTEQGRAAVLKLVAVSDALIEGFRPGVTEKLGLGPDDCLKVNPRLVYGRMTGWGQYGSMAQAAGHDINYIALAGVLHMIGRQGERPVPPLNLVGDFGGGALYMAVGVLAGIIESKKSGKGQVIDAAMVDGASSLATMMFGAHAAGAWSEERGTNTLDTGAPFYDTYETKDGKWVAIGPIEPKFYKLLLKLGGMSDIEELHPNNQLNRPMWPQQKDLMAKLFLKKTRDEWCQIMEGTDVCFAPVLSPSEAPEHPHMKERNSFVKFGKGYVPGPAPRFSRSGERAPEMPRKVGADTVEVLTSLGYSNEDIEGMVKSGAFAVPKSKSKL